jgi:hypothetical protein
MPVYRVDFSDSSFNVKKMKKWNGYQWDDAKDVQPIDCVSDDWDIARNQIIFQAHHFSTICKALRAMPSKKFLVPSGYATIAHQYWVSKKHQGHQMSTLTRPGSRAIAEKMDHRHRIGVISGHTGFITSGKFTKLYSENLGHDTFWSGTRLAEKIEAKADLVGKAPNVTQDVIEEMIGVAAVIGGIFT